MYALLSQTRRVSPSPGRLAAFWAAVAAGTLLRLWVATLGHNFDVESYQLVGHLVVAGKNVYANTPRYNYGPVWFAVLGALKWLQLRFGSDSVQTFHLIVAVILTGVDIATAWLLVRRVSIGAGAAFMLCPSTILLTGFHSQFDNIAVLFALLSWTLVADPLDRQRMPRVLAAAGLLGLSLATKHLLIFFPLWVLLWPRFGSLARRAAFAAGAGGVFVAGFIPFALSASAVAGIRQSVIGYQSNTSYALLAPLVGLLVPTSAVDAMFGWVPVFSGIKFVWLIAMVSVGVLTMRRAPRDAVYYYLIALVGLSPAMAAQYLAIPGVMLAARWRDPLSWIYVAVSVALLLQIDVNIGTLAPLAPVHQWLRAIGFTYANAQVWLLVMLGAWLYKAPHEQT